MLTSSVTGRDTGNENCSLFVPHLAKPECDLSSGVQIVKWREKQTMEKVKNEVAQHHHAMCVHSLSSCYTRTLDDS